MSSNTRRAAKTCPKQRRASMKSKEILAVEERLKRIRKHKVVSDLGVIPASIDFLDREIRRTNTAERKRDLYGLMIIECARFRRFDLTLLYRRQERDQFPEDPFVLTGLASILVYDNETQAEALAIAYQAANAAKKRGTWIRFCLTCLARIAIVVDDNRALTRALTELIEEGSEWREEDSPLEFDFLAQIEPGRVDDTLLKAYRSLTPVGPGEPTSHGRSD